MFYKIDESNTVKLSAIDSIQCERAEEAYSKHIPDRIVLGMSGGRIIVVDFDNFEDAQRAKEKLERKIFDDQNNTNSNPVDGLPKNDCP
jgi:hypothetical protein